MRAIRFPRSPRRQAALGALALLVVFLPDGFFSLITPVPWEQTILRFLGLIGISLLAVLPWVATSRTEVHRRLRWWSIPGVAATSVYLFSTDPVYLLVGFCLLTGAAVDTWMTRAHIASEVLRVRLLAKERFGR